MSASFDQLTTPLTFEEVRDSIYAVLATTGVTTTTWKPGAVLRTMIMGCALVIAALSRMAALIGRSGFLALSVGPWLALCSKYTFGVDQLTATTAAGTLTLDNLGGGVFGPFAVESVRFSSSVSGKVYVNTAIFSIAALQTGVAVPVRAVETGSASTANAGDITNIVTPAMNGVQCTNSTAIIGQDDEQAPALRARSLDSLGARSANGPADAYRFIAKSAGRDASGAPIIITDITPGTSIGINRVLPVKDGIGGLDVYLATATGGVTGTIGDLTTDLGAVDELLERYAAPLACTLRTRSASPVTVDVAYEIWLYQTALTDADIQAAVQAALAAFMPTRDIGGDVIAGAGAVWSSALEVIVGSTQAAPGTPLNIFRTIVSTPDTLLASNEVPVLGTVTQTAVHRVTRIGGT